MRCDGNQLNETTSVTNAGAVEKCSERACDRNPAAAEKTRDGNVHTCNFRDSRPNSAPDLKKNKALCPLPNPCGYCHSVGLPRGSCVEGV